MLALALALTMAQGASGCAKLDSDDEDLSAKLQKMEKELSSLKEKHLKLKRQVGQVSAMKNGSRIGHIVIAKHVHTDVKTACRKCHHKGLDFPYCRGCHKSPKQQKKVYHKVCGECHADHKVKTTCKSCHKYDLNAPRDHNPPASMGTRPEGDEKGATFSHEDAVKPRRMTP